MKRLKKIKIFSMIIVIVLSIITILLLYLGYLLTSFIETLFLEIFLYLLFLIIGFLLTGVLTYFVLGKLIKIFSNEKEVILINVKVDEFNDAELNNEKTKIKVINGYHLSTFSYHEINSLDVDKAKIIRKQANKLIKKNYKKANVIYSQNRHWKYEVNLFVIDEVLNLEEAKRFILKLNDPRLIEIKKINLLYIKNTETLFVREFKVDKDNFMEVFTYSKMLKLISKAYNLNYNKLINDM